MVRRLLLWLLPLGSSSREGRLDKHKHKGNSTSNRSIESETERAVTVLEYRPPLKPLRRVKEGKVKARGCIVGML